MTSQPLNDLPEPKKVSDAVDDLITDNVGAGSPFFKENGNYQAAQTIDMGFKKLLNLSTPSKPFEEYVDDKDAGIKKEVDDVKKTTDERPHIIMVHAHYHGHLHEGEYQFAFGGNIGAKGDTGFLVPQSGRIKKIQLKVSHEGKDLLKVYI